MRGTTFPRWTKPPRWYRQLLFIAGGQQQYNFDGDLTDRQVQLFGYIQPHNYWDINAFWIHRPSVLDDRLSRGGPVLRRPGSDFWATNASRSEEHTSELQSPCNLVCRLLLEKKKKKGVTTRSRSRRRRNARPLQPRRRPASAHTRRGPRA